MKMMEAEQLHVNKCQLKSLKKAYRHDVQATAARLALQFQAGKFDNTRAGPDDDLPFMKLEELCEQLPICRNTSTARMVLAVSRYAARATLSGENSDSFPADVWRNYAAWCFARDVHDEAISRGWSHSRAERTWQEKGSRRLGV